MITSERINDCNSLSNPAMIIEVRIKYSTLLNNQDMTTCIAY